MNYTLDMFIDSDLQICAEVYLKIAHNLLGKARSLKEVRKVFTGAQPLAQSRNWVEENLAEAEIVEVSTTAEAARLAAKAGKGTAAIANTLAAKIYGLGILAKNIGDISNNITRFLVIGKKSAKRTGHDKTSVVCSVKDKVGALYGMLMPFKRNKINLNSIESRPSKKKAWEYYFFIDLEGHREDAPVKKALAGLKQECDYLKVLGSFPSEKV
ncbi:MAG: prephenate dehydratase domain-containing protein [Candidatus Firestonebacteria bacterium]